ncbi:abhydrolase domain-containing 18 [Rhizobium leguminosarum bv. viciae]|uniref:alpha/beta hydrolase family protein n=1 Tax=Rhizobium leguminosarum TaxID=384 RepID=UPI00103CFDB2|nr:alpha/beta hydrolase family protein [Rhizobium leguminosarum]TBY66375.1 abhydrolase domain-containing 18 [Rhizobium leguminosarum bv. viciae]TBZ05049.1 abhydrolase domain-containing 18 [Rhizobium leguminosarum bv. viciae]
MFRYLAGRYDRKNIGRSLTRQKRIKHRAIPFRFDDSFALRTIPEAEKFFEPLGAAVPLVEEAGRVVFTSDIQSDDEKNNEFGCLIADSGSKGHALVVFHHWYARRRYPAFSKFFASRGITVVEATLPFHFDRASDEFSEEKLLNADLGMTVGSLRQAVLDGRKIVRWLHAQGYSEISVVGMCIGGLIAGLIASYEHKVGKAVLMVAPDGLADMVWTGETFRRLRDRLGSSISLEELRNAWRLLDLRKNLWELSRPGLDLMFVVGKNDKIVRPEVSGGLVDDLRACNLSPQMVRLNCGHSSVGMFPYNIIAARRVLRFLKETPTLAELWEMRGFRYDFSETQMKPTRWSWLSSAALRKRLDS